MLMVKAQGAREEIVMEEEETLISIVLAERVSAMTLFVADAVEVIHANSSTVKILAEAATVIEVTAATAVVLAVTALALVTAPAPVIAIDATEGVVIDHAPMIVIVIAAALPRAIVVTDAIDLAAAIVVNSLLLLQLPLQNLLLCYRLFLLKINLHERGTIGFHNVVKY